MGQIYRHVAPNGKSYVGMTSKTWQQRVGAHPAAAYAPKFRNAILKYGWDNFQHEILEIVEDNSKLLEREAYWINYYNSAVEGYNSLSDGRDHSSKNYINEITKDTKIEMKYKYIDEGYSVREMIEHFNMNWDRIRSILESLNIEIRSNNYITPRQLQRQNEKKWRPDELICAEESCENLFIPSRKNQLYCSKSCSGLQGAKTTTKLYGGSVKNSPGEISKKLLGNKNAMGNKGGNITAHNRHHVNKNIFIEFCELCVMHCEENSIALTITKNKLLNDFNNGLSKHAIAKKYNVSYDLVHKWLKNS